MIGDGALGPSSCAMCRRTMWRFRPRSIAAAIVARFAHFAHEYHVGVHPQGATDRLGKVGDVDADLALVDQRLLVFVEVLDRVFNGDDVPVFIVVASS